jgi:ADP-heptose:LPS heptosyltransferase
MFRNIEYVPNFTQFETIELLREYAFENAERYINIFFDGDGRQTEPNDPPHLGFTVYPDIDLPRISSKKQPGFSLVIQLHSGARPENQRGLDISWIVNVCRALARTEIRVVILGTGAGYSSSELLALKSLPPHVTTLVGATKIVEWLSIIASADYLITPEGLASFFALSQRVPAIVLYDEVFALLRMPRQWREASICVRPTLTFNHGSTARWLPFSVRKTVSILLARLDPEAASRYDRNRYSKN